MRSCGDSLIFCAFNLSDSAAMISLPKGQWTPIGSELGSVVELPAGCLYVDDEPGDEVQLAAWQSCIAISCTGLKLETGNKAWQI